jgi:hypothetical protein
MVFIMDSKNNTHKAKIKFSLRSKEFEISGDEQFVNDQIENFKSIIQGSLEKLIVQENLDTSKKTAVYLPSASDEIEVVDYVVEKPQTTESTGLAHENVLVIDGDVVKVIADVPGNTTSKKMINVILLYMWGKMQLGIIDVTFKELRDMCVDYGEVDKPNFSLHLNKQKKLLLTSGSGQSQSAKLIRPGIKTAEELIKQLNNE